MKLVFPIRATFLTKSAKSSGTRNSDFIRFLRIWINKVKSEELFVISWLGSSECPLVKILARIFKATCKDYFLSLYFKSDGVIWKTPIILSNKCDSCLKLVAPTSSDDYFSYFCHTSSNILGDKISSSVDTVGYPSKSKEGRHLSA